MGFIEKLSHFDAEVGKACSVIKQTLQQIVEKQFNLSDVFGELIDEVLHAEAGDNEDAYDVQKTTSKSDDILPQTAEGCTCPAPPTVPDMSTPVSQLDTQFTDTQGKHGDGGKNMPTNTNVTPKATPHMDPDAPIFDATPQIKSTGGVQQVAETDLPDSGPCFDQTPSEHVYVETDPATNTPQVGQASLDSEMQTVLALREYLCGLQSDTGRTIIDYGEYSATCSDIYESFADGKCLDNVFMQCFIQCVIDDAKNQQTSMSSNSLVLDVNVGSILNFEEQERHSRNPQPFDESVLHTLLDNSLPETDELDQCKAIMVPMVSRGHWTLYVVNKVKKCIHILDSNPYGPTLGGTTWKDYHFAHLGSGGRKLPWAKVIMSRLNKAIQHVRPSTCFPKFGNFTIDLCPNCPNMAAGSNDCGFYVMGYILFYQCDEGSLRSDIEAGNTSEIRSLALHYITFHPKNKALSLLQDIQRFKV
ncbi:uncharacterized protein [Zea mays]|uniref:uncharacterized protein n=1 Tax=Zea mays TaxID=4577 RepID=UPI0004DE937E|nr:uncharacterized protein LOC103635992 [Zea mays]